MPAVSANCDISSHSPTEGDTSHAVKASGTCGRAIAGAALSIDDYSFFHAEKHSGAVRFANAAFQPAGQDGTNEAGMQIVLPCKLGSADAPPIQLSARLLKCKYPFSHSLPSYIMKKLCE
jgi:hypothetical protein